MSVQYRRGRTRYLLSAGRAAEVTMETEATLLGLAECIAAVEEGFRLHAEGMGLPPGVLETLTADGFHIKVEPIRESGRSSHAGIICAAVRGRTKNLTSAHEPCQASI